MTGKAKCKILKEIRQQIASSNDIPYVVSECRYQGDCSGTCPKCEEELRYLEKELKKRQSLGKAVALSGLVASLTIGLSGCTDIQDMASRYMTQGFIVPELESTASHSNEQNECDEYSICTDYYL